MEAYVYDLYKALGIFIPLIVVNCIILGRAEAFASKNNILLSMVDGVGMGIGFTLALVVLGAVRELFGAGGIFGYSLFGAAYPPFLLMILPPRITSYNVCYTKLLRLCRLPYLLQDRPGSLSY